MIENLLCEHLSWVQIKKLPRNKLVSTSYIWIVIVPIIAKIFSKIEDVISFDLGDKSYQIILELPFSWQIFFWSALAFTFGNILFAIFCPPIIKQYENFDDFMLNGGSASKIKNEPEIKHINNALSVDGKRDGKLEVYFWAAYDAYSTENCVYRIITAAFYFIGVLLFLCVSVSNIIWVIFNGYVF